jgi:trehalose 6-phosphate synthase
MLRTRDAFSGSAHQGAYETGIAKFARTDIDGQLIAVSNRVSRPAGGSPPGGLALALSEALETRGGTWIGWSGDLAERPEDARFDVSRENGVRYGLLDLPKGDFQGFYEGYANGVLWPVFHDRPDLADHGHDAFDAYKAVNMAFARAIASVAKPGDTVWVHDYHFLLLADALRRADVSLTTGLFLHTPFPHAQTFRTIPEAEDVARALMSFDVIGVQTKRDAQNLAESLVGLSEGTASQEADRIVVRAWGETLTVRARPIGIDGAAIRRERDAPGSEEVQRYLESVAGRYSMIGVDRLDYSKGLPQKLEAYYTYLKNDPDRAGDTVLTQIAPISRGTVPAYVATRREVERFAGKICGQFGSLTGGPLRLLTRAWARRAIAQLMAASDAALVTPTADGMNLVAKEFVAVQDPNDPGVLILSEFAGAAEEMTDALLVNPRDVDGVAEALERARAMPLPERRERNAALARVVEDTAIERWIARCQQDLAEAAG